MPIDIKGVRFPDPSSFNYKFEDYHKRSFITFQL